MSQPSATVSTTQLANRWQVKPAKILNLIRAGELEAFDVALKPGGRPRYRITPEAIRAFEQRRSAKPAPKQPRRVRIPKKGPNFIEYI